MMARGVRTSDAHGAADYKWLQNFQKLENDLVHAGGLACRDRQARSKISTETWPCIDPDAPTDLSLTPPLVRLQIDAFLTRARRRRHSQPRVHPS